VNLSLLSLFLSLIFSTLSSWSVFYLYTHCLLKEIDDIIKQQHKSLSEYLATAMSGGKREEFDIANYRSLTIVDGVTEESHIDKDDVCNATCLITILGDFEGGELEFSILGVRFRMRPGDIAIFQSHLLHHKTSHIKEGGRHFFLVLFTHQNLFNTYTRKYFKIINIVFKLYFCKIEQLCNSI
jgi:hypothetical protein